MTDERSGITTALEMINATSEPAPEGDQVDMFEADAPMPIEQRAKSGPKGGRPLGSRNKSTDDWREYLLSRYRSPLVTLLEMCNRSPVELAEEMGLYKRVQMGTGVWVDRLDTGAAASMQMEALKAVAPYLHQKQPMAIELPADTTAPLLVIGSLNVGDKAASGLQIPVANDEQHQQVIDVTPVKSETEQSET